MLRKVSVSELKMNPFELIGEEWMLLTAGSEESFNTMTASWGGIGVLWNKNVLTCYVRPQRYTNEFMSSGECFTASFFGKGNQRAALSLCGSKSGRDCPKVEESGLTPIFAQAPYFAEAELVLVCRKLHSQAIDPSGFCDSDINKNYAAEDYHILYVGEIVDVLKQE